MPALHSHTHCQAAQAHAKTQAWQRVCLSQRSTEPTEKRTDEQDARFPTAKVSLPRTMGNNDTSEARVELR